MPLAAGERTGKGLIAAAVGIGIVAYLATRPPLRLHGPRRGVPATRTVSGTFDGGLKRYYGIGDGGQSEDQDPVFVVKDGGTIKNVIIGVPAGDGIHCQGSCTIRNVRWLDVGEDAATFEGTSSSTKVVVDGAGPRRHPTRCSSTTVTIRSFQVQDFGKLYRPCGNCRTQEQEDRDRRDSHRAVTGEDARRHQHRSRRHREAVGHHDRRNSKKKISICDRYTGDSSGKGPKKTGKGADGEYCKHSTSDIAHQ